MTCIEPDKNRIQVNSRYQMHHRIATESGVWAKALHALQRLTPKQPFLLPLVALVLIVSLCPQLAQAQTPAGAPVILTPVENTSAQLQTHTTDIQLEQAGASVVGTAQTLYRLRNEGVSAVSVTLRASSPTPSGPVPLPADLRITAGGSAIALEESEGGAQITVSVPASGRLDLRLSYTYNLGDASVVVAHYQAGALGNWARSTSFRLAFLVPPSIPEDAWLSIAPAGWRYGPSESADLISIRWLTEGNLPAAFAFTFVNPALAQQELSLRAAASSGGVVEKSALGNHYAELAAGAQDAATRERYYGQAMAAYSDAVSQGTASGTLPGDMAQAYIGQARLLRQRIVASGGVSAEHARLLVDVGMKALSALAVDAPQRAEVEQWLSDGLALVLADARSRRDWQGALGILAQMEVNASANTAGSAFSAEAIAEERRRILFEQSLQLLEEGERDAAIAVSGEGIVGPELQPPADAQSLFSSWQNTVTVTANGTTLELTALAAPGKFDAALAAAQTLANAWSDSAGRTTGSVAFNAPPGPSTDPFVFTIRLPAGATGLALANSTPLRPDWALPRLLLTQLAPETSGESTFLRRSVLLKLALDLRSAGEQWLRLATDLEAQAFALDAQSSPSDRSSADALESALKARVQAANYRAEANNWRSLAENSQTVALLEGPRGAPSDARAWQVTVSDPPQVLQFSTWGMNQGGVLALVAAALAAILLLAAILWSLL